MSKENVSEYTSFSNDIPYIKQIQGKDPRRIERRNYIPHRTPVRTYRNKWEDAYRFQLEDMYNIVINIITERYPKKKINWDSYTNYKALSELIFHCSSKHISEFLDYPEEPLQNELKD